MLGVGCRFFVPHLYAGLLEMAVLTPEGLNMNSRRYKPTEGSICVCNPEGVEIAYQRDIQKLAASVIMKVRISFERSVDFNPKKGEAKDIMAAATCMLAE